MLSATNPRPKTLTDADIKYLKDLLDKAARLSFEQIWTEVSGRRGMRLRYRNLTRMTYHSIKIGQAKKLHRTPHTN